MRILIVAYFFPPLNAGACQRPYSWAKHWSRAGHDVTVLTVHRQLSGPDYVPLPFDGFSVQDIRGINPYQKMRMVLAARNAASRRPQPPQPLSVLLSVAQGWLNRWLMHTGVFFQRFPSLIDSWIMPATRWAAGNGHWDVVVSSYGPYANHLVAWQLKRRSPRTRWIADFRDLWTDGHPFYGVFPLTAVEQVLERKVISDADVVTTVSRPLAEVLERKYPGRTVKVIDNGFDPDDRAGLPPQPSFPNDGKVRLVYTGSLYRGKRDPSPLFQAILRIDQGPQRQLLSRLDVVFAGLDPADLPQLIKQYGVERWVRYAGYLDRTHALAMQRDAQVLLFLDWNDPAVDGIVTGKLFEYLFSNSMIWVVGNPMETTAKRLVRDFDAGIVLYDRVGEIEQALIGLLRSRKKANREPSPRLLRCYGRRALALRMLELAGALEEGRGVRRTER